ncbi:MAG: 3'-5' exonuclease [Verrucomicrobia bacterium]|nr:3'-5' exonuclease [Verrucomicrobiota bacterium]
MMAMIFPMGIAAATSLTNLTFVAFDLETTGLSREYGRVVEIGAVKFRNGEILESRMWLVNPGQKIPKAAQWVHGISDDMVADQPPFKDVYPEFVSFIDGAILMAHNANFDVRFMRAEALRNDFPLPTNTVLDSLALARRYYPDAESYTLEKLMVQLNLPATRYHRGMDDAKYVRDIFVTMTAGQDPSLESLIKIADVPFKGKPTKPKAKSKPKKTAPKPKVSLEPKSASSGS